MTHARRVALIPLAAVTLAGCGGDESAPGEVIRASRAEEIELVVGRESGHDAVVEAVLDPVDHRFADDLAVNVFRSADDAERFAATLESSRQTWPRFLRRGNVIAFFERDGELARRIDAAMNHL